ncbi:FUSC family protein [Aquitalea sp. ASV11]|uniref:FUSC family protein n=1 Tax=Aquitalea sp. ASV11 TaxID=2795103 RepID=UPI0018EA546E|nr:FUSC family protein [Aquitalea sp. ASV11]
MQPARPVPRIRALIAREWQQLRSFQASDRPWQMPLTAALATGLPLLIAAWTGHLAFGLLSSLGGMAFLYLPATPMHHRMVTIMACSFGLIASFTLGLLSQLLPLATAPVLAVITILVTMICRFYRLPPPGSYFFVMLAALAAYTPVPMLEIPLRVGLVAMGSLLACVLAFGYSLHVLRWRTPKPVQPLPAPDFDFVVMDALIIGLTIFLSLVLAEWLQLQRPYWVPVSCLAVLQGASLRAVWNRQLQRLLGTALGLLLTWGVFSLPLNAWTVSLLVMLLSVVVETLVVRHYGMAAVFITPMAILLAEAAHLGHGSAFALIEARFYDTLAGGLVGLLGGLALHLPALRQGISRLILRLLPVKDSN